MEFLERVLIGVGAFKPKDNQKPVLCLMPKLLPNGINLAKIQKLLICIEFFGDQLVLEELTKWIQLILPIQLKIFKLEFHMNWLSRQEMPMEPHNCLLPSNSLQL